VFDQSLAHALLAPDALHAFEMNKSNGGAQRKQKDTVIPMNNPCETGKAKGLQQTLEEHGFDVNKMRVECSPVCPFENQKCCMA